MQLECVACLICICFKAVNNKHEVMTKRHDSLPVKRYCKSISLILSSENHFLIFFANRDALTMNLTQ